ncbi:hypothetical protein SIN8267_01879 [Sinobacterium norvegicum]|uniref:Fatty acid cis/trans isomerase n=1 Tax=Sinobacterium norvegicum TaxID=1641715 RepID=A0ABN8EJ48_9GAMM|nr:fatty acid cis/trans isomerase [Sinobacterium norvegicum]CAH0991765.1 hypothetical protein SIN8267_01879 [Sinobacterium norvegicum]
MKTPQTLKKLVTGFIILTFLAGCSVMLKHRYDQLYGPASVKDRVVPETTAQTPIYHGEVKEIIDNRCVVCHGCYDAPCQLKMSSHQAIDRGASQAVVYDGTRLFTESLTRMFVDAENTEQWRAKGFFSVLNERDQLTEANLMGSSFYRMLALKEQHPLPEQDILPNSFDFGLNRKQYCSKIEDFDRFEKKKPLWGMPYALPGLKQEELDTLTQWLAAGAKTTAQQPLDNAYLQQIEHWENYLNGDSLKQQLVARYIFEHLYIANIYFPDAGPTAGDERQFFKLVRSTTATGEAVNLIPSRRPFDSPKTDQFYYRFVPYIPTVTVKNHMPYRLDANREQRWNEIFFNNAYTVTSLPSYKPAIAANPFETFEQIPSVSRYKFMLDEAEFTISGFIKGPVCRGQIALNVIHDQFWVMFVSPPTEGEYQMDNFLKAQEKNLRLPAEDTGTILPVSAWRRYSKLNQRYNDAWLEEFNKIFPNETERSLDLGIIWDGDNHNDNAALTIFRHFDSATVVKGFWGKQPKTAWIIDYPLLERIHYLLVAGYDVYGNVNHQLLTRLYMDFLRMDGEDNFLMLLPSEASEKELNSWYRDSESNVANYIENIKSRNDDYLGIEYTTDNPKQELLDKIIASMPSAVLVRDEINRPQPNSNPSNTLSELQRLASLKGEKLKEMPELAYMRLRLTTGEDKTYTLIRNLSHTNVSYLFGEKSRIVSKELTLSVMDGVVGSYPNLFLTVDEQDLADFVSRVEALSDEASYRSLLDRYGVRRSNKNFWQYSDWLHDQYFQHQPLNAGLLDYNRLQNR